MGPPAFLRRPGFTPVDSHPWFNISIIAAIPGQCGRNSIEDSRMLPALLTNSLASSPLADGGKNVLNRPWSRGKGRFVTGDVHGTTKTASRSLSAPKAQHY